MKFFLIWNWFWNRFGVFLLFIRFVIVHNQAYKKIKLFNQRTQNINITSSNMPKQSLNPWKVCYWPLNFNFFRYYGLSVFIATLNNLLNIIWILVNYYCCPLNESTPTHIPTTPYQVEHNRTWYVKNVANWLLSLAKRINREPNR